MTRLFFVLIFIFTVNNPAWAANWNQGSSSDSGPKKTSTRVHSYGPVKGVDVSTYVASGKIIIASNLSVYKNILTNKVNSIVINDDVNQWSKMINKAYILKPVFLIIIMKIIEMIITINMVKKLYRLT